MEKIKTRFNKFRDVLFKEQNRIISAAISLMVLSLLTKFSGMIFTAVFAQKFGADIESDIYNAASIIPEMITAVFLIGAVSGSVIPIFIKAKSKESQEDFLRFFNSLLNSGLIVFGILAILVMLFANQFLDLIVELKLLDLTNYTRSGTLSEAEIPILMNHIASTMRWLMLPQAILGIGAYISSALNVYERFIIPSLAPLFYNLGKIFGALVLVEFLHGSIMGVVWGTIIGSLLHVIIQVPLALHLGVRYKPVVDWKIKYMREVVKLGFPRMISLAGEQISLSVSRVIAFPIIQGALSAFNYALNLVSVPLSLFGATFAIAAFPTLSKFYDQGDLESFSKVFRKVFNQIFFYALPSAVLIFVLRLPFTRLFYGILGGEFDWEDTRQVAWVILFFTIGLPFETMRSFLYRVFYAAHDSIKPFIGSVVVVLLDIVSSIMLSNYFSHFSGYDINQLLFDTTNGVTLFPDFALNKFFTKGTGENGIGGLALGSSIVFISEFLLLMFMLYRKKIITNLRKVLKDILKKLFASLIILIFSYIMYKSWENILNTAKTVNVLILTGSTLFSTSMVYLWICYVLRVSEVDMILDVLRNYWLKCEKFLPILKTIREKV